MATKFQGQIRAAKKIGRVPAKQPHVVETHPKNPKVGRNGYARNDNMRLNLRGR